MLVLNKKDIALCCITEVHVEIASVASVINTVAAIIRRVSCCSCGSVSRDVRSCCCGCGLMVFDFLLSECAGLVEEGAEYYSVILSCSHECRVCRYCDGLVIIS